jgi:hypothetical protein
MKFFSFWRSLASFRVRIALNLKGLPADVSFVDLDADAHRGEDYRRLNPQMALPALVEDDGTGFSEPSDTAAQGLANMRQRAAAGPIAGRTLGIAQPGVHKHRQGIRGLTGCGYVIQIARIVPGHEDLIGGRAGAENVLPTARGLGVGRFPALPDLGHKIGLMCLQIRRQRLRRRPGVRPIRGLAAITRIAQHADLVFHLHHDHCVVAAINLSKVLHQRREGPQLDGRFLGQIGDVSRLSRRVEQPSRRVFLERSLTLGGLAILGEDDVAGSKKELR